MNKVQIRILAKDLGVKPQAILDILPELGVEGGKTYLSFVEADDAEKVRVRLTEKAQPTSQPSSTGASAAQTSIDLSHISKPGDVLKALLAKKKEKGEEARLAQWSATPVAPVVQPRPVVPAKAPAVAAPPVTSPPVAVAIRPAPRKIIPQPPSAQPGVTHPPAPRVTTPRQPVAAPQIAISPPTSFLHPESSFEHTKHPEKTVAPTFQIATKEDVLLQDGNEFSFMHDEKLRAIAKGDAAELSKVRTVGAHKCRLILVGAIIETLLLDALQPFEKDLQQSRFAKKFSGGQKLSKWDLMVLIDAALDRKIVSKRIEPLIDAVRRGRNLVHPGNAMDEAYILEEEANLADNILKVVKGDLEQSARKRSSGQ